MRNNKVNQILKWKGQTVTIELLNLEEAARRQSNRFERRGPGTVNECNQFYVTYKNELGNLESAPLRRVELSFDHAEKRLKLEIYPL